MIRLATVLIYVAVLGSAMWIPLFDFEPPASSIRLAALSGGDSDEGASPESRTLPDDWRDHTVESREVHYRLTLDLDEAPAEFWALVIPNVRMNLKVSINGTPVGSGGRWADPVARNLRNPLIFSLPDGLLHAGSNQVDVSVRAAADGFGYLGPLFIGPERDLRPAYQRYYFVRVTLVAVITVIIVLVGGVIGVLAMIRRKDREYTWFTVGTLIWALHSISYFTVEIPFSDRVWDWLVFATLGWFAILGGVIYVHRYLGIRHPLGERSVVIAGVVLTLAMAALPTAWFYAFAYFVWHPLCQTVGTYGLVRMLHATWQSGSLQRHVISASGLVLVGYAGHDLLVILGVLDWSRGYIIQYSMPLILFLFCIVLLQRFVASVSAAEQLNAELEQRVEQRRIELEATYERLGRSEQQRLLAQERERIMRDMHDGVGGQLISALTSIRNGDADLGTVEQSLQTALNDLRLMIDSFDQDVQSLPTLLGMFRMRVEPSLQAQGIKLEWQVAAIDEIPGFGSQQALHLLRILQEFVTNTLRHSGATRLRVRAGEVVEQHDRHVRIHLADNGCGRQPSDIDGRGIANMHYRAEQIAVRVDFQSDAEGTRLSLLVPA